MFINHEELGNKLWCVETVQIDAISISLHFIPVFMENFVISGRNGGRIKISTFSACTVIILKLHRDGKFYEFCTKKVH